jgi:hypothetical protein
MNESKKENYYKIILYCEDKLENFYMKSGLGKKIFKWQFTYSFIL